MRICTRVIPFFAFLILLPTPLFAQDELEEKIWSLEEDYISYFKEANHQAILSLYHSQVLAWPDSELHPAGKKEAKIYLEENYPEPIEVVFQIHREGIRIIGNVAITHYLLISTWVDEQGVEQKSESRITHTWIKEDSQWKILGGMSNSK